jgi:integrase
MGNFRARITKSLIDRLQPGDYVSDISLNGFAARCQNVCVSYVVKVSINNRAKLFTIGKHGQPWTPDAARKRAMEIKCDPYAAMKEKIKNPTVKELAKPFIEDHLSTLKTSTRNDYTSIFNNKILTFFKSTDVRSIKRVDCSKFHRKYAATPRMANYSLAVLSVFLNWCEEMGCRDENSNPCFKIKRFPEVERQRYLTDQEVIAIGKALRELEQKGDISIYAGAAIRLLVLSGARKNEILALKHEYINYQQKIAYLPDSKTGQKKIKLNGPALNIIKSLPRHIKNEYVIVGRRKGQPLE